MERGPDGAVREAMAAKGRTPAGAALYRQRKGIVEPVLGILKEVLGFRQFSRRGLTAATSEFTLLALAYKIKILARGTPRAAPPLRRLVSLLERGRSLLGASRPAVGPGRPGVLSWAPPDRSVAHRPQRYLDGLLGAVDHTGTPPPPGRR